MFERFQQMATAAATSASRREFLGRMGRGVLTVAAAAVGFLATGFEAQAAKAPPKACGTSSDIYCRGLVEGAYCQIGTTGGLCVGAPACYCRPSTRRGRR